MFFKIGVPLKFHKIHEKSSALESFLMKLQASGEVRREFSSLSSSQLLKIINSFMTEAVII